MDGFGPDRSTKTRPGTPPGHNNAVQRPKTVKLVVVETTIDNVAAAVAVKVVVVGAIDDAVETARTIAAMVVATAVQVG